ncbi:hypothetical protein BVX98_05355 [bacterium F11]|nr:hypothetical protein BVX98_05355 [bacterium F11]
MTWIVALVGLLLTTFLMAMQLVAVIKPRGEWTIKNVYGGDPSTTDPKAYFAFNQGYAWADSFFWGPIQIIGSVGMLYGQKWGFLLALIGSVPFWYSAIPFFIWNRMMEIQKNTVFYWIFVWGIWPVFGLTETAYCFFRLLAS